jgi:D-alanyl-D-alanine carboxypeptidase
LKNIRADETKFQAFLQPILTQQAGSSRYNDRNIRYQKSECFASIATHRVGLETPVNSLSRVALTLVVAGMIAAQVRSAEPPKPPETFDLAAIDSYVAGQVHDKGYVGLSLAIARDGQIVFAKGYGKSSLEPAADVGVDTSFAIGSITKQFTCACIFMLAEEGKLSVQDPVSKYYPGLARAADITLYDLMSHVSGYPDYYPLDFVDRRMLKPIELDKLIQDYAGAKLDFDPRTRWSYSNTGFIILGRVVEKVSGDTFGQFLERRIFKPLMMEHTYFEPGKSVQGLARGYTSFALGAPETAVPEAEGWIYSAGGIFASASDLARWDLALATGKVLKPDSYKFMTTARRLANGKSAGYGCGLVIAERDGEAILRHSGAVSGYLAYNAIVPRTKSAVVLLSNSELHGVDAIHETILGLVLKDQTEKEGPAVPKVKGLDAKAAALDFFHQLQAGKVDRTKLGEEFSVFLTDDRVKAASERFKPLGEPEKVEVRGTYERGGMEVARIRMTFKTTVLTGLLYRTPDGIIQQLLLNKE